MAIRVELPPLPQFDSLNDRSSLSQRWKAWTRRLETYLVASNINDDEQKRALLLPSRLRNTGHLRHANTFLPQGGFGGFGRTPPPTGEFRKISDACREKPLQQGGLYPVRHVFECVYSSPVRVRSSTRNYYLLLVVDSPPSPLFFVFCLRFQDFGRLFLFQEPV